MMKKYLILLVLIVLSGTVFSQGVHNEKRGTIRVRKTGKLIKVAYDHVNYRLIGVDRFGNPLDTAIVSFDMSVTIRGQFYTEKAMGNSLTHQMQKLLSRCDSKTPLFFKNIKAKDSYGTVIDAPKFQYLLGRSNDF